MEKVEMQETTRAKLRLVTTTGYSGMTLLTRLTHLYGFNPFTDMVHDSMHLVLLNLCRKLFMRIFKDERYIPDTNTFNEMLVNFPFTPSK